jgi:ferredoxin-NADP reductase
VLSWQIGTVQSVKAETGTARTFVLRIPGWRGHLAGQHLDLKLTAEDGYSAVRSYSIASAFIPGPAAHDVELTVEQIADGEVSPYLAMQLVAGDQIEVRGPIGGWFVWRPEQPDPVQLVAGGSGIVPLMSMVRACIAAGAPPMRLLYSVRSPETVIYASELRRLAEQGNLDLTLVYTRAAPEGSTRQPKRIDVDLLPAVTWAPADPPTCYICGPSAFVERATLLLQAASHDSARIRTERFGP